MNKSAILIMTSIILLGWISNVYASEILGYSLVEKQAKFYTIILSVIAASVALVAGSYLVFWLIDTKKNFAKSSGQEGAFAGELIIAAQSAK